MLDRLLVLNLACLIGHQVDAAYWHEWELFGLPGGIQVFDLFNVVAFAVLLLCMRLVIRRTPSGYWCALFIAGCGMLVLPVHAGFWLVGAAGFDLPVSMLLIFAGFPLALLQGMATFQNRGEFLSADA